MQLYDFQLDLDNAIDDSYNRGNNVVMPVLPTGGGKTVIVSNQVRKQIKPSCAIAHRQELVSQISLSFARFELQHRIIAPKNVIKEIASIHSDELGTSKFINPGAQVAVAGVDTILKRTEELAAWLPTIGLVVIDEGHHVLQANKWGKAFELFPNARGLFPTATPRRADRLGLGVDSDGLVDEIVEGPSMRELINRGRLCDYKIICAGDAAKYFGQVKVSDKTGDYNATGLQKASKNKKTEIAGDVVGEYLKHAGGKRGVTFACDIETATEIAASYRAAGVPAEVVSSHTPARARGAILREFRDGKLLQLVNVDIFGEGFDLPAIEVASFARPTKSFSLFCQQFGRALRTLEGKSVAIIIDHVGNVLEHGLPDAPQVWTVDRGTSRPKREADDAIPLRACACCSQPYEAVLPECPWCGEPYMPADRSSPRTVAGDLVELDADVLAALRGEVEKADESPENVQRRTAVVAGDVAARGAANHQRRRIDTQQALRSSMSWWGGYHAEQGRQTAEIQKRFYHAFEIDVLSAQALKRADALALANKINADIGRLQSERVA